MVAVPGDALPGGAPGESRAGGASASGAAFQATLAILADRRTPGVCVLEVGGVRLASLPPERVEQLGLREGIEVTPELRARIEHVAEVEAAHRVAVRLLAGRPRSVGEVLKGLRDRGHNPAAAAEVVGRLEVQGLLDDWEFARHVARVKLERGYGPARVVSDLLAKGVDRRLAERAVGEVMAVEGVEPIERARVLAGRKLAGLGGLPGPKKRRRLLAYLNRRGFQGYEVRRMVGELVARGG